MLFLNPIPEGFGVLLELKPYRGTVPLYPLDRILDCCAIKVVHTRLVQEIASSGLAQSFPEPTQAKHNQSDLYSFSCDSVNQVHTFWKRLLSEIESGQTECRDSSQGVKDGRRSEKRQTADTALIVRALKGEVTATNQVFQSLASAAYS